MSEPRYRKGDRVRITREITLNEVDADSLNAGKTRSVLLSLDRSQVELVERADNPANDPIGTVRREDHDGGHSVFVKDTGYHPWVCVFSTASGNTGGSLGNDEVVGMSVTGTVPGTPAAAAAAKDKESSPTVACCHDQDGDLWFELASGEWTMGDDRESAERRLRRGVSRWRQWTIGRLHEELGPITGVTP